jgi:hypothetical protein
MPGESAAGMICGKCAACKRGRGNCANPAAAGCLAMTWLMMIAPTALIALAVKAARR